MTDTPKSETAPQSETVQMSEAQRRAAQRDARVAAKLRENLRRRKAATRKQKSGSGE